MAKRDKKQQEVLPLVEEAQIIETQEPTTEVDENTFGQKVDHGHVGRMFEAFSTDANPEVDLEAIRRQFSVHGDETFEEEIEISTSETELEETTEQVSAETVTSENKISKEELEAELIAKANKQREMLNQQQAPKYGSDLEKTVHEEIISKKERKRLDQIASLTQDIENHRNNVLTIENTLEELKNKIIDLTSKLHESNLNKRVAESTIEANTVTLEASNKEIDSLGNYIETNEDINSKNEVHISNNENELGVNHDSINQTELTISNYEKEINKHQDLLKTLATELLKVQDKKNILTGKTVELEHDLKTSEDKKVLLEDEAKVLEDSAAVLREEISNLEARIISLQKREDDYKQQLVNLEKELVSLTTEKQRLETEDIDLTNEKQQLEIREQELRAHIQELENARNVLEQNISNAKQEIARLQDVIENLEATFREYNEREQVTVRELETLRNNEQAIVDTEPTHLTIRSDLEIEKRNLEEETIQLETKYAELQEEKARLEDAKKVKAQLLSEIETNTSILNNHNRALEENIAREHAAETDLNVILENPYYVDLKEREEHIREVLVKAYVEREEVTKETAKIPGLRAELQNDIQVTDELKDGEFDLIKKAKEHVHFIQPENHPSLSIVRDQLDTVIKNLEQAVVPNLISEKSEDISRRIENLFVFEQELNSRRLVYEEIIPKCEKEITDLEDFKVKETNVRNIIESILNEQTMIRANVETSQNILKELNVKLEEVQKYLNTEEKVLMEEKQNRLRLTQVQELLVLNNENNIKNEQTIADIQVAKQRLADFINQLEVKLAEIKQTKDIKDSQVVTNNNLINEQQIILDKNIASLSDNRNEFAIDKDNLQKNEIAQKENVEAHQLNRQNFEANTKSISICNESINTTRVNIEETANAILADQNTLALKKSELEDNRTQFATNRNAFQENNILIVKLKSSIEETANTIVACESQIIHVQDQIEVSTTTVTTTLASLQELRDVIAKANEIAEQIRIKVSEIKSEVSETNSKTVEFKTKLESLKHVGTQLTEENQKMTSNIENLNNELIQVEIDLKASMEQIAVEVASLNKLNKLIVVFENQLNVVQTAQA